MVSTGQLAGFAALTFIMVVIPGPSVLFAISRAITVGRRDALISVVGNSTGVYLQVVAVAVGLGALVTTSAAVFTTIKLIGAGYLVYLGVQALRHRRSLTDALTTQAQVAPRPVHTVLRVGFVVGFANPKSIVFLAALLPQFANPAAGPVLPQMLVLGLCLPIIALATDSAWAMVASTARTWFARSPRRLELIGGTGGLVMIGLGTTLAFTGRRD